MAHSSEAVRLVAKLLYGVINSYCVVAASALVIYEHFLLLPQEVAYFWWTPLTGATALFFASRYITLVHAFYTLVTRFTPSTTARYAVHTGNALDYLRYFIWAAFSSLRALALMRLRPSYNLWMGRTVAGLIFLLSMVPFGIGFSGYSFTEPAEVTPGHCSAAITWSAELSKQRAYLYYSNMRYSIKADTELIPLPGLYCFAAMCALNILHVVLTVLAFTDPASGHSYVTVFTQPMTSIFVSRFLVRLQRANLKAAQDGVLSYSDESEPSTVRFERTMGSLCYTSVSYDHRPEDVRASEGDHEMLEYEYEDRIRTKDGTRDS
ncbi:uncharacterized protein BXZ73DRAFT_108060 [Epithele typhae]|uniref:uncharacterized protein n=1 Tax=Epithele typhae TaxID=378194 RepID=UPI0020074A8E|nr:uncharacterized protein BXZ73DRAFT_108060 [Epithele typhae]KAH9911362.1 hypothetical protein BXZ73DRAFT_108060 [Epithele typhae]